MSAENNQAANNPYPQPSQTAMRRDGASIGPKTHIKGDLHAEEDLLIEGKITGMVVLKSNQLAVGSQGRIVGTAFANVVVVDGTIEGDIYAVERIAIKKSARIQGAVMAPRVSLEDGAHLRGSVEMDPDAIKEAVQAKFGDLLQPSRPEVKPSSPVAAVPPRTVAVERKDEAVKDAAGDKDASGKTESNAASK